MIDRRGSLGDDGGYVIVMVLAMLLIALAFATAGLSAALNSHAFTNRDARVRRAQQAADAGIQAELYQQAQADLGSTSYNLNGGPLGLSSFLDCTVPQLSLSGQITGIISVNANAAGVCPQAVDPSNNPTAFTPALGNHTTYQAEMLTSQQNFPTGSIGNQAGGAMRELFPKIISIGSETSAVPAGSGTVHSREEVILAPIAPLQAIEGEHSVTITGLQACVLVCIPVAGVLNGDVLSNGNLTTPPLALLGLNLSGGLLATLAYSGTYNGGLSVANVQHVSSSQIIQRPTVTVGSKPPCGTASGTVIPCPSWSGSGALQGYNATTDTFSMTSGTATFAPGDYVFCNFSATGGTVNVNPSSSAPVRIYVDSPTSTRCATNGLGSNQGNFNDTASFSNGLLGTGGVLDPSGMQIYVVGNGTAGGTTVQIGPASTNGLLSLSSLTLGAIVYAPTSNLTVNVPGSVGTFDGALVGYNTTVGAAVITQDLDIGNYPLYAGINAFRPVQYVQCSTSVTSLTRSTSDLSGC
jgi:hypothetical protein